MWSSFATDKGRTDLRNCCLAAEACCAKMVERSYSDNTSATDWEKMENETLDGK